MHSQFGGSALPRGRTKSRMEVSIVDGAEDSRQFGDPNMPTRKINLYAMHGRAESALLDYPHFFEWLQTVEGSPSRLNVWDDLVFVLEGVRREENFFVLDFISGDPAEVPVLFDEATSAIIANTAVKEAWPASRTRVVADAGKRLIALEVRRSGVSKKNLEKYFQVLARDRGYAQDLSLSLTPVASDSFVEELAKFERIREASIVVIEPNPGWLDSPDVLSDLASSSNGRKASATVTAPRNGSLARDSGIVAIIAAQAQVRLTSVDKASVSGVKVGEDAEVTITSDGHQRRAAVAFEKRTRPSEVVARVIAAAKGLIAESDPDPD